MSHHSHSKKQKRSFHSRHHDHRPSVKSRDLLADAYSKLSKGRPVSAGHAAHPMGHHESIREIDYDGHHVSIVTRYEIKVDGKPITGHVYVDNDGKVSTHALPAYSFASTVDMVKKLIDAFPDNFGKKR